MTARGQFLERPTLIPLPGGRNLEGLWHRGERAPSVLLIGPTPGDGSMDAAMLNELAFAATRAGHPSLRFNFAGTGASPGPRATSSGQLALEVRAAARTLRRTTGVVSPLVVGFRSGVPLALSAAASVRACGLLLISGPAECDLSALVARPLPAAFVVGEEEPGRPFWLRSGAALDRPVEVVAGASSAWLRGLPQVGRQLVELLARVAPAKVASGLPTGEGEGEEEPFELEQPSFEPIPLDEDDSES